MSIEETFADNCFVSPNATKAVASFATSRLTAGIIPTYDSSPEAVGGEAGHVRFGSIADILHCNRHVQADMCASRAQSLYKTMSPIIERACAAL